jgi:cell division protein FtsN
MAEDNQGSRTFLAIVLGGIVLALVIAAYFMYGHKGETTVKSDQPPVEQSSPEQPMVAPEADTQAPPPDTEAQAPDNDAPMAEDPSTPDEEGSPESGGAEGAPADTPDTPAEGQQNP